jgi:hypothetical protein
MKTIPSHVRHIIRNHKDLAALGILVGFEPKYHRKAIEQYEFASHRVRPEYRLSWGEYKDSVQHIRFIIPQEKQLQNLWHTIMGSQLASQVHQWAYKES